MNHQKDSLFHEANGVLARWEESMIKGEAMIKGWKTKGAVFDYDRYSEYEWEEIEANADLCISSFEELMGKLDFK
jgi:hypothetical protein